MGDYVFGRIIYVLYNARTTQEKEAVYLLHLFYALLHANVSANRIFLQKMLAKLASRGRIIMLLVSWWNIYSAILWYCVPPALWIMYYCPTTSYMTEQLNMHSFKCLCTSHDVVEILWTSFLMYTLQCKYICRFVVIGNGWSLHELYGTEIINMPRDIVNVKTLVV